MPSVKISELPVIDHYSTNTEATLVVGVDLSTGTTGKSTLTTLGEGLYAYQPLKVGENQVLFSNTIGQFSGNSNTFLQINNQNFSSLGSSDYVASTSDSDNLSKYIDMGINGPSFGDSVYSSMKPYDGYLYVYGPSSLSASGNLVVGTASAYSNIVYIVGGTTTSNIVARMTKTDLQLSANYNLKFGDGSIQSVAASPANYSQAAFTLANNGSVLAQASFNTANTAASNTVISQGTNVTQNTRLTVIEGTDVSQNARMTIIEGTNVSQNVRIDYSNTALTIAQGVDNSQNVRIDYSNTALTIAQGVDNSQNVRIDYSNTAITIAQGVDNSQNTAIAATDGKMQSAYNTANSALANTSGTFAGNLTITGNLLTQGTVSLNNSSFNANSPFIKITASNNFTTVAPSNTNYMLQITGKANSVTRVVLDSFGQNTYPVVIGRMGRGSADLPTATANGDVMMRIVGNGYTGTQFPPSSPTKIDFVASENFSNTNRGTQIQFWNTPTGSNTIQKIASFNADSATFTGTISPTKGFIYTPLVYPSTQTAITIDFANNSMVRAQTSSGIVVSMSNYTVGKIVELWITNLAGTGQTYTTGVPAINSTLNDTTFSIPATSTICARYFCVDGTLANTLVSVIHA